MKNRIHPLPVLLGLAALLAGCPPSTYRLGVRAANDGQYHEAAKLWIQALDEDIYQTKPQAKLTEYGKLAWDQLRSLAQEHEASGRYAESAATYEEMFQFAEDLDSVEQLTFPTDDVKAEYEDVLAAWAKDEFARAVAADEASSWAEAMTHFEKVRELDAAFPSLDEKQGLTYLLWAEEDLAKYRYEDAADHYFRAYELTRRQHPEGWAGAVNVALARYALSKKKCRTAVKRFERVTDDLLLADPALDADREQAEDCARIGIIMEPVTEEVEFRHGETALASMLVDLLEREIANESSRFVRLLAADVLDAVENPPDHRVRVSGRITQAVVEQPATTEERRSTVGRMLVDCDKETLLYEPDAICTEDVDVEYTHHRTAVIVRMAGSVKMVDLSDGEQTTRPLEISLSHDTTHASDFQVYQEGTWVPTHIGPEPEIGRIAVADEVRALDRKPLPLPPESELVSDAIQVLAEAAGIAVLETVDKEDPPPPPKRLEIREPKILPEDFTFAAPTEPIVQPEPGEATPTADAAAKWAPAWKAEARKAQRAELEGQLDAEDTEADVPLLLKLAEIALFDDLQNFESYAARVEALKPEHPTVAVLRIALRSRMGLHEKAEERFLAWLDAHPDDGLAWKYYGLMRADAKRPEARQALENAQRLGFSDDYVSNTLEMVYTLETKPAPAPEAP